MSHLVVPKIECIECEDSYSRFAAQPLERGFGNTLGNALRRVLLSSLQGAAINWAKIEGVQHEFSAVPYMKEDVIEFLLNVKAIRLHPLTGRSGKLFLEVEGEGCVYAADIKPSMDFDVVNPELYLATLDSSEARLYAEFNVELGEGYVPAGSRDGLPIGAIPVDAIFTPIRKVNYAIEPTHIGRQAAYEKLTLEVWTDGTVSPLEAVSQAAQILIEQFAPFTAAARPPQEETKKELPPISPEQYNIPIKQLGFSPHIVNRLRRNKITKLGELIEKTDKEFLSLKELGPKSLEEVQQQLKELGLTLTTEAVEAIEEAKGEEEIEGEEEEKV